MKDLKKQVMGYINAAAGTAAVFLILGLVFVIFPGASVNLIRWGLAIITLIIGAILIGRDLVVETRLFSTMGLGVALVVIGLILAIYPSVMEILPILIGLWLIVSAVRSLQFMNATKVEAVRAVTIITAILSIVCGILLILNPWRGSEIVMVVIGVIMIIHAVSSLVDVLTLKSNLKKMAKNFRTMKQVTEDVVKEAKVVKKRK